MTLATDPTQAELLLTMDKINSEIGKTKSNYREAIQLIFTLKLLRTNGLLHLCDDCKKQTLENAKTKAKELGIILE